jgi:hypothetical protein
VQEQTAERPLPAAADDLEPSHHSVARSRLARLRDELPMLLIVAGVFLFCVVNQHTGHDWGDDFSLYLRQAKGLVQGRVGDVLADNRYTVDNSSWSTFSPYSYPWGFPLLLAPFYAWRGLDYGFFKLLEAAFFAAFLFVFARILRRRIGEIPAATLVLLVGLSVPYVSWTDTVLSEFPYLFALAVALWWMDRCRERDLLDGPSLRPLIVLGFLVGFAYTVRREGMAVLLALVALHVVSIAPRLWRARHEQPWRAVRWSRLATPYLAAFAWVAGLQLVLPTVVYQSFPNTGLSQVKPNVIWYRDILAEHLGLKDVGYPQLELLGSGGLARLALGLFVALSVVGLVARAVRATVLDASLIGYLVGVCAIFAVTPFHEGRYLFSITPLMGYFALHGVALVVEALVPRRTGRARVGVAAGAAFLAVFMLANAHDLWQRTELRRELGEYVIWGPEDPNAQQMFAAVRATTEEDDVIGFFRARAMNLYSDRRSLQITSLAHVVERTDAYVMAKNSTYSQILLTDDEAAAAGLQKVWENGFFVIFRVPDA